MAQERVYIRRDADNLEIPQEVREKMARAANTPGLIDERVVSDLYYVNVTHNAYRRIKRVMDIVLSVMALVILLIPMLIVALVIFVDDPGKIFFCQYRVGLGGRRFKLYKLRTMKSETPKYMSTSEVENPNQYITRVGWILRKWSIDELPQLINIIKGDMSIVGPRPLISDEYEIHDLRFKCGVYTVRPGLTGLAQINGRDTVTPADKVRWDVRYLEDFGFLMDARIVLATIPKLFGANGVEEGFNCAANHNQKGIKG